MLSYVHRQRALSKKREEAFAKLWDVYSLKLEEGALNFEQVFGNNNPVNFEIGFGMGDGFFTNVANYPEQNFIGVEVHHPGVGALLLKLLDNRLKNIRIFEENAVSVLQQCIPDQSLERIFIFFPDPWPKRRHYKRRLIQPVFSEMLYNKLKAKGYLHFATDDVSYAKHVMKVVAAIPGFDIMGPMINSVAVWPRPVSKFAMRAEKSASNEKIWDLIFVKK